ncbi:MAG: hypothetical protein H8E98_05035 [Bacteroidetes bacterium]|nr:hypothetical protein [Bacteroidota bacterium]
MANLTYSQALSNFTGDFPALITNMGDLGSFMMVGLLLGFWVILLIMMSRTSGDYTKGITSSSFIISVISFLMWSIGLIGLQYVFISMIITIAGTVAMWKGND